MARRPPKPCYHRGQHRWYVTLDGREYYLHKGKRPWARALPRDLLPEYDRVVSAWQAGRALQPALPGADPSLDELWHAYLAHCKEHYHRPDGTTSRELLGINAACSVAARLYGERPARLFGADQLEAVQQEYKRRGWGRAYLRQGVMRVRRMFAWAVKKKLVPNGVLAELQAVPTLGERDGVPEPEPIADVPDAVVEATLPHLPVELAALVRAHRLIGCRAAEIVAMTPAEVKRESDPASSTGEIWLWTPTKSKNKAHYWIGPRAQAVIAPWLAASKGPGEPVFPKRGRTHKRWTTALYREKVRLVCQAHGLPHWYPLQIRHAAAEEARRGHAAGIEAAQARLYHKKLTTSQVYAHKMDELGRDVARRLG